MNALNDRADPQLPVNAPANGAAGIEPPYFDPAALRRELAQLRHTIDDDQDCRKALIERLKTLVGTAREAACARLEFDGNGLACARGLSEFQDELIRLIRDYAGEYIYTATNPSDGERMAIIATGGYGRGLLAPGSDIDLLFLLPYKQTPWGESVAEYILYVLWDLGFKVGHATRTIDQSIKLALADNTIRTSLLDMRLISGDTELFVALERRLRSDVIRSTARQFIEAKMAERDERHRRSGESRYRVEPNIKDGKGGLRDLHTLHWITKYLLGADLATGTGEEKVFSAEELVTYRRCEQFLWAVRCHLHFLTGRAEERLSFDIQQAMAERLGYRSTASARPVERFMKHYFLTAKDVGDLTGILCATLEMQQMMNAPRIGQLLNPLTWATRRQVRTRTEFRIDNERLNIAAPDVFPRDPVNLLRVFAVADETGTFLHPFALRVLRRSLRLVDDELRANPEANRIFLQLLTSRNAPETILRQMNEAGLLGRFVTEFGHVVAMMQFNMYHHYTVDEHLLRTVGQLQAIENGKFAETLPLSTKIAPSVQNRRALYVAAFLHDIAKGREQDHSILGARIARALGPRLGLTQAETETTAWLIAEHLTMSNISQSRDLSDPKTIRDFAAVVQSPERLKLLLLLTVADIRAVGPGTWNGWKGQLLRQLYWETEPLVTGGHTQVSRRERIAIAQEDIRRELADWPADKVEAFVARLYDDYWLKTETRKQADHARLIERAESQGLKLASDYTSDGFTAITELSLLAPNHPRLLALFAGCCSAAGANIIGAHISTTRDGLALDTFMLQREFSQDDDEKRRINRISHTIESVLKGEVRLVELIAGRRPSERRIQAFTLEPEVMINNSLSDHFTVVEVSGLDRPGLLYAITSELADLSLDITSAHITTFGEKVVDVFYVTDLTGKKIDATPRQDIIRERLCAILADPGSVEPAGLPASFGSSAGT